MNLRRTIALAAVLLASSVLLWSAIGKLEDPYGFADIVRSHGLVPDPMADHAAWGLIVAEVVIGVSTLWWTLSVQHFRRALWMLAAMFSVFAVYAMCLVFLPPPGPTACGCSGAGTAGTPADWRFLTVQNSASAVVLGLVSCIAPPPVFRRHAWQRDAIPA
ncbi:MAG: MauE/DoxX family redox-associated membrane protein [Phycisphaerales bacterium]